MKLLSRDLFYLFILIILVKTAVSYHTEVPQAEVQTSDLIELGAAPQTEPTINAEITRIVDPEAPSIAFTAPEPQTPSTPHIPSFDAIPTPEKPRIENDTLEHVFMTQINTLSQQIDTFMHRIHDSTEYAAQLKSLKQKLTHVRLAFQQFLATPSPVENAYEYLEQDLLRTANKFGALMHNLTDKAQEFMPAESIGNAITANQSILEKNA